MLTLHFSPGILSNYLIMMAVMESESGPETMWKLSTQAFRHLSASSFVVNLIKYEDQQNAQKVVRCFITERCL